MKLKLISSRPVPLIIDGEKRMMDISLQGARGRIAALSTTRRCQAIYLEKPANSGDAWSAWSNGFEVADCSDARRIAQQLVASGLAVPV